jgi:3-hydroxymyristoyl/3-hydroxydecanoyl-(acyl carrier protein) dehydratase
MSEKQATMQPAAVLLDVMGIQKILPHRYPFLLLDAIVEMEPRRRVVAACATLSPPTKL